MQFNSVTSDFIWGTFHWERNLVLCVLELQLPRESQANVPLIYSSSTLTEPIDISKKRILFIVSPYNYVYLILNDWNQKETEQKYRKLVPRVIFNDLQK